MTLKKGEKSRWDYEYGAYDGPTKDWPIVSSRTAALISVIIVLGIVLKFVVVSTDKPLAFVLLDSGLFTVEKVKVSLNWLSEHWGHLFWPVIKGLSFTVFSSMLLYLDSKAPGLNPPVTLSPRKQGPYGINHHIGYLTSFASGLVISSLSLWSV